MSLEKTKDLIRKDIAVNLLEPNPLNPNEMTDADFNMLVDNIERVGLTDPIFVRPHPEKDGKYRIIGGKHRWEVAKLLGYEEVPCTVITDPHFTEDEEKFQIVRHNIIHGKMSPKKFMDLYSSLNEKYTEEVAQEMFGFVSEDEFRKLIAATAKTLPPELQAEFKEAAKEVKTIDDLSKILNRLFTQYGDTLPYGYMIFDYGGKDSIWLRLQHGGMENFQAIAAKCRERSKAVDHVIHAFLQSVANGELDDVFGKLLDEAPAVKLKDTATLPTLDFLDE